MSNSSTFWIPTPIEIKCLDHLDHSENWSILREERPPEDMELSWRPFRRIWWINFAQYVIILAVLFAGLESTLGPSVSEVRSDLPYGIAAVLTIASALAGYVTYLYRRTWNRRARHLQANTPQSNS